MRDHVIVLGVRVDAISKEALTGEIGRIIDANGHEYLANVNIHAVNIARSNCAYRSFVNASTIVYCDGEGVRLGARLLGHRLPPRIVLTYWIWELSAFCEKRGYSIFLLGSTEENVQAAGKELLKRFPGLKIAGMHHGFFRKEGAESDEVVRLVNAARPNVLFVCFGMPLQEQWVERNLGGLTANVILFGGSTIDYTAGKKKVAPRWMCEVGLEWLYRLGQEPGRLWKRYLIGNPAFMLAVIAQRLRPGKSQ